MYKVLQFFLTEKIRKVHVVLLVFKTKSTILWKL